MLEEDHEEKLCKLTYSTPIFLVCQLGLPSKVNYIGSPREERIYRECNKMIGSIVVGRIVAWKCKMVNSFVDRDN